MYFVAKIFKDVYTFHVLKSDKVYDNGRHFAKENLGRLHIVKFQYVASVGNG